MMRLTAALAMVALAGSAALGIALLSEGSARAGETRAERDVIATAVANGFGVKLTAIRHRVAGEPDTATVRIAAFERSGDSWERIGRHRVGRRRGWFWQVVTHPYGVRRLRLSRSQGACPERVAVRLLVTPAIGPSAKFRFATCDGRFRPVDV